MSTPQGHRGTILVADDNEANRELVSALLGADGYQVVCVADGRQARDFADAFFFQLWQRIKLSGQALCRGECLERIEKVM